MKDKIFNCQDLFCDLRQKIKKYFERIKKNGGFNIYLRALTAQILWFTLFYNIGILLIPTKDYLLSHSILVYVLVSLISIKAVAGDKIMKGINYYISGDFFHKFDIHFLNRSIFLMIVLSLFCVFLNNVNLSNLKPYARKK